MYYKYKFFFLQVYTRFSILHKNKNIWNHMDDVMGHIHVNFISQIF